MNEAVTAFIKSIRYKPNIAVLIPADNSMGLPLIESEMIYIPFFRVLSETVCALETEIFVEYPSGTVLFYQKIKEPVKISYDAQKLLAVKRKLLSPEAAINSKELISEISYVSREMALIYEKAAKEQRK